MWRWNITIAVEDKVMVNSHPLYIWTTTWGGHCHRFIFSRKRISLYIFSDLKHIWCYYMILYLFSVWLVYFVLFPSGKPNLVQLFHSFSPFIAASRHQGHSPVHSTWQRPLYVHCHARYQRGWWQVQLQVLTLNTHTSVINASNLAFSKVFVCCTLYWYIR